MKRSAGSFVCSECGHEAPKWLGKCPDCSSWNTFSEQKAYKPPSLSDVAANRPEPVSIADISLSDESRFVTGFEEFDRVLGGGVVAGSVVLLGGEPGIGKSTLLMQICRSLSGASETLYVSGEESPRQLRLRAERLGVSALRVLAHTELEGVLFAAERESPDILLIDSIQTLHAADFAGAPGSIGQVKGCALALTQLAKHKGITVVIVGHVNKEGSIAGPKVLEHMVDCVLLFEGDRRSSYRILRAEKNRFGSTREIGVFEMSREGLAQVQNPSRSLLSGRPLHAPGSCVACVMEGSRPILSEIQALLTLTAFGVPRRMASGFDYNRAMLLLAVLEKRGGVFMGNQDAYINVVGGLRLSEPSADLPAILALASSSKDKPLARGTAAFGEVGLTGELRAARDIGVRLSEIARLGFARAIIPHHGAKGLDIPSGLEVVRAKTIRDAIEAGFAP